MAYQRNALRIQHPSNQQRR